MIYHQFKNKQVGLFQKLLYLMLIKIHTAIHIIRGVSVIEILAIIFIEMIIHAIMKCPPNHINLKLNWQYFSLSSRALSSEKTYKHCGYIHWSPNVGNMTCSRKTLMRLTYSNYGLGNPKDTQLDLLVFFMQSRVRCFSFVFLIRSLLSNSCFVFFDLDAIGLREVFNVTFFLYLCTAVTIDRKPQRF